MLDADERQEWVHQAGKIAEMAGIVWLKLLEASIPPELAERMAFEWWRVSIQPKMEFPDFSAFLRGGEGEDQ